MDAKKIRSTFFEFFESKGHKIVDSAPIVLKNDPTLMFVNAGMVQFKDYFLGTKTPEIRRIADTQKCLRVSGKHNDLEEVGRDSYHHTMFEMLGNWSFGDYFKEEAIEYAWELLIKVYGIDEKRLYVTVFGGDSNEGLGKDYEAADFWKKWVPEDRILFCGKEDNFWEMGDTGPCGPCSEIHVDLRSEEERAKGPAHHLVNMDDPLVVEIWNLVFIQFNRKSNGSLEELPDKHVDTGMGFERLAMAMQGKDANYDTDIFSPFIKEIEAKTGIEYTNKYDDSSKTDIAMRVLVDHIRAVSFTIADGELPSNTGAGYVIRRILRRAVRYYYSFLNIKEPYLYTMVGPLSDAFANVFPELKAQTGFVEKVIMEEEKSFLNTLSAGLKRLETLDQSSGTIAGEDAFELFDTYGFPIDLTMLIASEKGVKVDFEGFKAALEKQKERGRKDAQRETGDWNIVDQETEVEFVGYDHLTSKDSKILRTRTVKIKDKEQFHLVLNKTPFYAEGGGQVGDTGYMMVGDEKINVINTKRENDLVIHFVDRLPANMDASVDCFVNASKRSLTENNHTATHLLHSALRSVLGTHVQQKGSLVKDEYLRFDFSHFQKMTDEEIQKVETIVNQKIRENIPLKEHRSIPIQDAKDAGAMMLFGEKYGDYVRMITFDPDYSNELCGGCHVSATGEIGFFRLKSESAIAAGVRRIEAVTANAAESIINEERHELSSIKSLFKNPKNTVQLVTDLQEENKKLAKQLESFKLQAAGSMQKDLMEQFEELNGINVLTKEIEMDDAKIAKTLITNLEKSKGNAVILLGVKSGPKVQLMLQVSKEVIASKGLHAGKIIKDLAKHINGGGGGQDFFASAGGSEASGISKAIEDLKGLL